MTDEHISVLLIEDNPGDARLVQEMLAEAAGVQFDLQIADRLSTGLERLAEGGLDGVLLDLSLPDSHGLDTLDKVRAQAPNLPIIVLTVTGDIDLAARAVQAGAQDYLVKGRLDSDLLERAIRCAVERKRLEEGFRKHHDHLEELVEERTADLVKTNEGLQQEIAERVRAEEALRESEELLRLLSEATFEGVLVHEGGILLRANGQFFEMFGYEPDELLGKQAIPLTVAPESSEFMRRQISLGLTGPYEVIALRKDGTRFPIEVRARLMEYGGRTVRVAVARDIAERVRAEEALQRQAAQLEALHQVSLDITAELELDALLQSIVERAIRLLDAEAGGMYLYRPERDALVWTVTVGPGMAHTGTELQRGEGLSGKVWEAGEPIIVDDYRHWEGRAAIYEGRPWTAILGVPIAWGGELLGVINLMSDAEVRTFTSDDACLLSQFADQAAIAIANARLFEQVRAGRERLRALSRRLVEVQEVERRHIAHELHDEIGQIITGLSLAIEMSTRLPADEARLSQSEAQALVNELMTRVRDLSLDLRPAMLDDLGLLPALLWHFERYTALTKVRVDFKHTGLDRRFRPEVETAVYRIVQEALTNVARHAGVSEVRVRLWASRDMLGVQIEDQGVGFDPEAALAASNTSGLAGMRERLALLGGHLAVDSAPGAGSRLMAELPVSMRLEGAVEDDDDSAGG
jgi:PAS domain S-box-containing protein